MVKRTFLAFHLSSPFQVLLRPNRPAYNFRKAGQREMVTFSLRGFPSDDVYAAVCFSLDRTQLYRRVERTEGKYTLLDIYIINTLV